MKVTKYYAINFDEPCRDWLCAANLKLALEQVCINTKFNVVEIDNIEAEIQRNIENRDW